MFELLKLIFQVNFVQIDRICYLLSFNINIDTII